VGLGGRQDINKGLKRGRILEFRRSPVKAGHELFRVPADFKAEVYMDFTFKVAFGESQVIECEPIIDAVR
jgi:hypothetical protein